MKYGVLVLACGLDLACSSLDRNSQLDAAKAEPWTATVEPQTDSKQYNLKIFKANNHTGKPIFESLCQEEFTAPAGKRLKCETNSLHRYDVVEVVFRQDTKKGALVFRTEHLSRGKSHNLACEVKAEGPTYPPFHLACFERLKPEGPARPGLRSPFPSTIPGLGLPNAHLVAADTQDRGAVYRGMAPLTTKSSPDLKSLIDDLGITSFVIFKDETEHEVSDEVAALLAKSIKKEDIHQIPFKYKGFENFAEACKHTIQALRAISSEQKQRQSVFFHCTVGEDRTGMLAGIYKMVFENTPVRAAFDFEMCEHGYSAGNPQKPYKNVVQPIDQELTVVFLKMAYKISKKTITPWQLSESVCDHDPQDEEEFRSSPLYRAKDYRCGTSTWFQP